MSSLQTTFTTFASATRSGGAVSWTSPSNAQTSNNGYASLTYSGSGYSNWLTAVDTTDLVPDGATITGIAIVIEKADSSGRVSDSSVKLIVGGSIVGTEHAAAGAWTSADQTITYGGDGDLWGQTLTPAIVNASNFGAALSAGWTA
jgi:hypothetical protein